MSQAFFSMFLFVALSSGTRTHKWVTKKAADAASLLFHVSSWERSPLALAQTGSLKRKGAGCPRRCQQGAVAVLRRVDGWMDGSEESSGRILMSRRITGCGDGKGRCKSFRPLSDS